MINLSLNGCSFVNGNHREHLHSHCKVVELKINYAYVLTNNKYKLLYNLAFLFQVCHPQTQVMFLPGVAHRVKIDIINIILSIFPSAWY